MNINLGRVSSTRCDLAVMFLVTVSITVVLATLETAIVFANDCVGASSREAFGAAALVFRGKVVNVEDTASISPPVDSRTGKLVLQPVGGFKIVTISASRFWKGPSNPTVQLLILGNPSMGNSFRFQIGSEYIVYALDEVEQKWPEIRRFTQQSKVYGIGVGCTLRVRSDVDVEARLLNTEVRKLETSRPGAKK